MKILFVRHGESSDDLIDAYGGWQDFPLTEKGVSQLEMSAEKIANLGVSFEKVFSSPLSRATASANIIAKKLNISVEVCEYFKERNTYGVLSGMVKSEAKIKYPDQVANLDSDEYVDGSERKEDLKIRVAKAINMIKSEELESVIVVAHSVIFKEVFLQLLNKKLVKKGDGAFILLEIDDNVAKVITADGIELGD